MASKVDHVAIKERYLSIIRENGIAPNMTDIDVVVPPLHGDHFASSCDAITIHQGKDEEKLELFTKRMVENPEYSQMLREMKIFDKEAGFFNTLVPLLNDFIKSRVNPSEYVLDMFPKCYYADKEIVIMENLAKKNYILLDKVARQDLSNARMYMKTLAKYNAPSYVLISEEKSVQDFIVKYEDLMFEAMDNENMGKWIIPMFAVVAQVLKTDSSPAGVRAYKLAEEIRINVQERLLAPLSLKEDHVCYVLNHGDTWSSNMLFRQDPVTKKLIHHVLIDFQCYRVSSPNTDLGYYLFSSVKSEVRQKEWKNLLKLYYDEFKANVEFLKGQVHFSFEEFVADYKRKFKMGFIIGACMLAGMQAMASVGDLEAVDGDIMEHVTAAVQKWAVKDPDTTRLMAKDLISFFQEYDELTSE